MPRCTTFKFSPPFLSSCKDSGSPTIAIDIAVEGGL